MGRINPRPVVFGLSSFREELFCGNKLDWYHPTIYVDLSIVRFLWVLGASLFSFWAMPCAISADDDHACRQVIRKELRAAGRQGAGAVEFGHENLLL